jgi:hypothetical protein
MSLTNSASSAWQRGSEAMQGRAGNPASHPRAVIPIRACDMTYVVEIFCEAPACNARRCTVITADYGDNPEPKIWLCPACGSKAKLYSKLPIEAYKEQQLASEARARRLRDWR